jgi:ribosome-binding protein aMBF1 (putative translation factor)
MTNEETSSEGIGLEMALNQAISSVDSRMNPIARAQAADRVAKRLNDALGAVADRRRNAVATAVTMPGMSMQRVADELGVSKSMVAKLAGPASMRENIAAGMRDHLESAFVYGAQEGKNQPR